MLCDPVGNQDHCHLLHVLFNAHLYGDDAAKLCLVWAVDYHGIQDNHRTGKKNVVICWLSVSSAALGSEVDRSKYTDMQGYSRFRM